MIGLNKIGLNQVRLNHLCLNTLCACQKSSGGDGFPRLPGDVTRWSFKGLTNEQMSKNPRLEDADHKGRFLTFKNFAWGGMSGVDGYKFNFLANEWVINNNQVSKKYSYKIVINNKQNSVQLYNRINLGHIKITLKITGIEINKSTFRVYYNAGTEHAQDYTKDGIYEIDYTSNEGANIIYFYVFGGNMGQLENPITIEQLPLYPGFIIGDGVDDYAVTEKNLDFEDTYTVYTAFIPSDDDLKDNSKRYGVCGKDYTKDFYLRYSYPNRSTFYSVSYNLDLTLSNGFNLIACKRTADKMQFKNLLTGASIEANAKTLVKNPGLYYLWRSAVSTSYAKAAIAGQVICNGHFTTDEEDTKVLNWYKKEYPWLFFDQAWTVVGKSNEDTDRATIANITGNGNNLVLSNFGFAGNSGYGEYAQNFNHYGFGNLKTITYTRTAASMQLDVPAGSSENIYSNADGEAPIGFVYNFNLKITGLKTGNLLSISQGSTLDNIIANINKDGVYNIKATVDDSWNQRRIYFWIRNSNGPETTLSIEQIPDYEGYLVTDGIDDKVYSSAFALGNKYTVVGENEILSNTYANAGIVKVSSFFVFPNSIGVTCYINRQSKGLAIPSKRLKSICSDGRIYYDDWAEAIDVGGNMESNNPTPLFLGYQNNEFTRFTFKNLAIYDNKTLSKEDAIKAYIYLQTLKAK